jgi:hypothetical protein
MHQQPGTFLSAALRASAAAMAEAETYLQGQWAETDAILTQRDGWLVKYQLLGISTSIWICKAILSTFPSNPFCFKVFDSLKDFGSFFGGVYCRW